MRCSKLGAPGFDETLHAVAERLCGPGTRTRRDAARALRRVRAEPPPRMRRAERADTPPQGDGPPRHQDEAGPDEPTTAADAPSGESDGPDHEQPEDAADL